MKNVMRVFSVVLLVMVGTVFAVGPAGLIVTLFKNGNVSGIVTSTEFWLWIILAYYFIATFISIDKIIGRIYPLFGICLIIMALGVALGIFTHSQYQIPEIWSHFTNMHPKATPIWSVMFITVACGAISGFHNTVTSYGSLYEVREAGTFRILWCNGCRRYYRFNMGSSRLFNL